LKEKPCVMLETAGDTLSKGSGMALSKKLGASTSTDLGYTHGTFEVRTKGATDRAAQSGYYVRVWKRQRSEGWKIEFEVATF